MRTSEITARLQHASPAVTRSWIRDNGLKLDSIDPKTRENRYKREDVDEAIENSVRRGPYRKRPPAAEGHRHEHGDLPPAGD